MDLNTMMPKTGYRFHSKTWGLIAVTIMLGTPNLHKWNKWLTPKEEDHVQCLLYNGKSFVIKMKWRERCVWMNVQGTC